MNYLWVLWLRYPRCLGSLVEGKDKYPSFIGTYTLFAQMLQTEWPHLNSLIINRVRIQIKLKTFVLGTCWTCVRHWNKHKLFSVINKYCKYQITQLLHISPSEHDVISMGQAQKCSDRLEFNPWSNGKRSHSSSDWMVNTDVQYGKGLRYVPFTVLFAQVIGILT